MPTGSTTAGSNSTASGRPRAVGEVGAPHSLHGVAWRRAWGVESDAADSCTLALRHRPTSAGDPDWPFAFETRQQFLLSAAGLSVRMSLTNLESTSAPAGLGFHSFFRRRAGETLAFEAGGAWRNGPDMLPSMLETDRDWNFAGGRALEGHALDNDFSGWTGVARMAAPGAATIRLRASRTFGALRLYTPAGADFYAAEPISHLANAINRPGLGEHAMTRLAPGATLSGEIDIDLVEAVA